MNEVKTKKGSVLPLLNLKGKSYLQVAHRLQWLSDDFENYTIDTELLTFNEDMAVAKATVVIYDDKGNVKRRATATKKETKKDFPDFIEKAETGSCGRALAMVGLGTQHALSDLDELQNSDGVKVDRLADSPVTNPKQSSTTPAVDVPKTSSFRPKASKPKTENSQGDEWQ